MTPPGFRSDPPPWLVESPDTAWRPDARRTSGVDFIGRAQAVVPDDAELLLAQVLARVVGDGSDTRLASILVQLRLGEASGSCTNGVSTALPRG